MDVYAKDTLEYNRSSLDVLEHRKTVIRKYGKGHLESLQYFGILSAMTDDRHGWDVFVDTVEDDLAPSLPFVAYNYMIMTQPDPDVRERWWFLLNQAAHQGHIYARLMVFDRKYSGLPIVGKLFSFLHRLIIGLLAVSLYLKDRSNPKLSNLLQKT